MFCNTFYPSRYSVYYATQSQNSFGEVEKVWTFNQVLRAGFSMSTNYKDQQVQADQNFWIQDIISGRTGFDPRKSSSGKLYAMTDVLIADIMDDKDNLIYTESAGVRSGMSTLFELAGVLPHTGPFGSIDYYKIVVKRSDAQELVN